MGKSTVKQLSESNHHSANSTSHKSSTTKHSLNKQNTSNTSSSSSKIVKCPPPSKQGENQSNHGSGKKTNKTGINEIDELFHNAAVAKKEEKKKQQQQQQQKRQTRQTQQQCIMNNSKKAIVNFKCNYDRSDIIQLEQQDPQTKQTAAKASTWASDGLGGVFNAEGYTGRQETTSGYKIYKAHLFNKKGFGNTKDCPFDCQCCFI